MVEIIFKPFKELVIMDYTPYTKPETLASTLSVALSAGQPVVLYWTEGVVFVPIPVPPETESMIEEYIRGRVYWSTVSFSLMPDFQPMIKVGGLEVPIVDVTPNSTLQQVARWLKGRIEGRRHEG